MPTPLIVTTFVSLDGIMQAPGGPGEDESHGFKLGGWVFPHTDDAFGEFIVATFNKAGAFLLGRTTYQIFAGHWPRVTDPNDPVARGLNTLPKYVASTTLREVTWNNSKLLRGDTVQEIEKLKQQDLGGKELQVHGSAGLIQTLLQNDLIDELRLLTFPVVLGGGKRLFDRGSVPRGLDLIESEVSSKGVLLSRYRFAGEVRTGSFALPE